MPRWYRCDTAIIDVLAGRSCAIAVRRLKRAIAEEWRHSSHEADHSTSAHSRSFISFWSRARLLARLENGVRRVCHSFFLDSGV